MLMFTQAYEAKSDTTKVSSCGASGYGHPSMDMKNPQENTVSVLRKYQSQAGNVLLVTVFWMSPVALFILPLRRFMSSRSRRSLWSSASTRLRRSSMLPSFLMSVTQSSRRRLSLGEPSCEKMGWFKVRGHFLVKLETRHHITKFQY